MTSRNLKLVNFHLVLALFMVLCPGKTEALAQGDQVKAQLHIPWNLLSERLRELANLNGSDGSATTNPIGNRLISVPYQGETIEWNLTGGTVAAKVNVDRAEINASSANVSIKSAQIQIILDQINVDQVIERNIGGVVVRVHLTASCGPITLMQPNATSSASFALNWQAGAPDAVLSALDLNWAPQSWMFNDFTCTGPSGLDTLVHDGIQNYLRDPADFKPYIVDYIASNLKTEIDSVIAKIRTPFMAGTGTSAITVAVGDLAPVSTGVIGDLSLKTDSKSVSLPAAPLPSSTVLTTLSKSQPTLVGDISVIEFLVAARLNSQGSSFRVDLQSVPAFHSLMQSRFKQFFAWADLLHYAKNAPFYLNLTNPRKLELVRPSGATSASALTSTIPIRSVIQSYRDNQWWSWVETAGKADVSVALSVKSGTLAYATTINDMTIKSQYATAYRNKYNKGSKSLPDALVASAIKGPQSALSGTMKWPDVDLAAAGKYRASGLTWVSRSTFSLNFSALK